MTDLAVNVRRWVMAICAALFVGLVLIAVEAPLGIGFGWRLVLNQVPTMLTTFKVLRWSGAFE